MRCVILTQVDCR